MSENNDSEDEIRKSIDVLDRVLSEFEDIETPFYGDETNQSFSQSSKEQEILFQPPPIDRNLKPKWSPPLLPQKLRNGHRNHPSYCHGNNLEYIQNSKELNTGKCVLGSCQNFSLSQRSQCSKRSEVSSHEYQEINGDFCSDLKVSHNFDMCPDSTRICSSPQRKFSHFCNSPTRSRVQNVPVNGNLSMECSPKRCRSGDIPVIDAVSRGRERRSGHRFPHQRRGHSTDRLLEHRPQYIVDPRRFSESRIHDHQLLDSRFVHGQRFDDSRLIDPRIRDQKICEEVTIDPRMADVGFYDPRLMEPTVGNHHFVMTEAGFPMEVSSNGYALENSINFPHLIPPNLLHHSPLVNYTLPQSGGFSYQPQVMHPYPYPHYPSSHVEPMLSTANPNCFDFPIQHGLKPQLNQFEQGFPIHSNRFCGTYPMDYPMDIPVSYPSDLQPLRFLPRERLSLDGGGRSFLSSKDSRFCHQRGWFPQTQEEAKMMKMQRTPRKEGMLIPDDIEDTEQNFFHNQHSMPDKRDRCIPFHTNNNNTSDSSEQNSPRIGSSPHQKPNPNKILKNNWVSEGHTREFDERDIISDRSQHLEDIPPGEFHGGKDSGFDEESSPIGGEPFQNVSTLGKCGGGGGSSFVVAGVFTDSSKMYIPAPPSPVPDYDNERYCSGDEDEDIPHEPFYVSSRKKHDTFEHQKQMVDSPERKISSESNKSGQSQDSLQTTHFHHKTPLKVVPSKDLKPETSSSSVSKNPLKAMIDKFHQDLPISGCNFEDEILFSDDSLEDEFSSMSSPLPPSRMSNTADSFCHKRLNSSESLDSIESSTTSFDYVSEFNGYCHSNIHKNQIIQHSLSPFRKVDSIGKGVSPRPGFKKVGINRSENSTPNTNTDSVETKKDLKKGVAKLNEIPRFDTVKNLMKEGLLEGLDEKPPDFVPPPPNKKTNSKSFSKADSGVGSNNSTPTRKDNLSEKIVVPGDNSMKPKSNTRIDSVVINKPLDRRRSSPVPPPLPPPRDTSIPPYNRTQHVSKNPISRNESWLYRDKGDLKLKSFAGSSVHSSQVKNHGSPSILKVRDRQNRSSMEDISIQDPNIVERNMTEHLKNRKNVLPSVESHKERPSVCDDQISLTAQDCCTNRSGPGKLFSKITESVSRSNSPSNTNKKSGKKAHAPKYHADFIRVPVNKKEAPKPPNPGHRQKEIEVMTSLITNSRDSSKKFRSVENLVTEASPTSKSLDFKKSDKNIIKKKTSTLPVSSSPSDMKKAEQSNSSDLHCKDELPSPKLKFSLFKGFWRRNKYSFDKS